MAKKFNSLLPGLEFVVEGDKYIIKTDSGVKNTATSFKLGEEFDDAMPTGDVLKVINYIKHKSLCNHTFFFIRA